MKYIVLVLFYIFVWIPFGMPFAILGFIFNTASLAFLFGVNFSSRLLDYLAKEIIND